MSRIVILGAGVMGSALAVPAADNGHDVLLAGTPLDEQIITALEADRAAHPKLGAPLPASIRPVMHDVLITADLEGADLVVLAVSSPGIDWGIATLRRLAGRPDHLALITKGLVGAPSAARPSTYADVLPEGLAGSACDGVPLVCIGGPCIARELALRQPTSVVYASRDPAATASVEQLLATDYYRVSLSADAVGVEACAALKNFMAIGVSAMAPAYPQMKNPTAALFNQAVRELAWLCEWAGGERATALDLAGMGDLHVTVGGGRNARLGVLLGEGARISEAMSGPLLGETVEGIDTGRNLATSLHVDDSRPALPLTDALLASILEDLPFAFDFRALC